MKYLWIGVGNSAEGRAHFVKNGAKLLSAEVSNDALVTGLKANGVYCDTINASSLPAYPQYLEKIVTAFSWTDSNGANGKSVSYLNYRYINLLSKKKALVIEARAWAEQNVNEDVTVFVYQMHTPFMAAAAEVKKLISTAKLILIVPDLPQFMDMNMSIMKKILKKIDWMSICRYMKSVDQYVLYSKHMAEFLGLQADSWMVMEGSFDSELLHIEEKKKTGDKVVVMYSGVLDLRYGIQELLEAFELLDDRYVLWLTGIGNAVPIIENKAAADRRIKYWGYLPSRQDLLDKQLEATVLISTRSTEEESSKYCFPSKVFEYMISGNPVISTRIQGIPDEYFDYLIPIEKVGKQEIADAINKVGDMSVEQRRELGQMGKQFVLNKKSNAAQAKRMLEFANK